MEIAMNGPSGLARVDQRLAHDGFREALQAVAGGHGYGIDTRRLGNWLGRNKNKIVDGMKIISAGTVEGDNHWQLVHLGADLREPAASVSGEMG